MAEEKKAQSKASKLYAEATTRLREENRERFDAILAELYQKAGMTYTKRKTAEQREAEKREAELAKARKRIAELQQKYPELEQDEVPVEIRSSDSADASDQRA
jgi:hypothetical protein